MPELRINGNTYDLDVEPDMPLLWAIRDVAGLTGTKFGCGAGLCGSCTIHLDGTAIRSCTTPVQVAVGREITTIEGLSENGDHRLQTVWRKRNVPQCGYCQAGQIMNAAALLASNASPTPEQIDDAMSGNLCRCGTYLRIREAIQEAAAMGASEKGEAE